METCSSLWKCGREHLSCLSQWGPPSAVAPLKIWLMSLFCFFFWDARRLKPSFSSPPAETSQAKRLQNLLRVQLHFSFGHQLQLVKYCGWSITIFGLGISVSTKQILADVCESWRLEKEQYQKKKRKKKAKQNTLKSTKGSNCVEHSESLLFRLYSAFDCNHVKGWGSSPTLALDAHSYSGSF